MILRQGRTVYWGTGARASPTPSGGALKALLVGRLLMLLHFKFITLMKIGPSKQQSNKSQIFIYKSQSHDFYDFYL